MSGRSVDDRKLHKVSHQPLKSIEAGFDELSARAVYVVQYTSSQSSKDFRLCSTSGRLVRVSVKRRRRKTAKRRNIAGFAYLR